MKWGYKVDKVLKVYKVDTQGRPQGTLQLDNLITL